MRLVTVFKSRKKEIMGIFNLVQSNPTQNAIQSNPILSIRSQSHCNNFEYFRNCKFVHTATEKPDRYRQRKILRTHQEYGLGVGSRIKILPNLLIILNTGCRVQLDDRPSTSTEVTVRRLSFWLNDADLFSGTKIPQSPNQHLKFVSSKLHSSNGKNHLVYYFSAVHCENSMR